MTGQEFRRRRAGKATPDTAPERAGARPRARGEGWIWGRHAVAAVLANPRRRWRRLAVLQADAREAARLAAATRAERQGDGDALAVLDRGALNLLLPEGAVHQGWAIEAEPLAQPDLDELIAAAEAASGRAIIIVLDQVTDPHNIGAVLRSAAAFGAAAVVTAEHAAPAITGTLAKTASGALEQVPVVRVINLARALDRLKENGYWCCGLDERAPATLAALDLGPRVALVLGSEGGGLRRLVREHCDYLARLPTRPELPSLNVSNAAAIALYELARDFPVS
jgi:23S rRNA (guanosine2251-2'-O)-methyltransferase